VVLWAEKRSTHSNLSVHPFYVEGASPPRGGGGQHTHGNKTSPPTPFETCPTIDLCLSEGAVCACVSVCVCVFAEEPGDLN